MPRKKADTAKDSSPSIRTFFNTAPLRELTNNAPAHPAPAAQPATAGNPKSDQNRGSGGNTNASAGGSGSGSRAQKRSMREEEEGEEVNYSGTFL
jgi:hypothetical protein